MPETDPYQNGIRLDDPLRYLLECVLSGEDGVDYVKAVEADGGETVDIGDGISFRVSADGDVTVHFERIQ